MDHTRAVPTWIARWSRQDRYQNWRRPQVWIRACSWAAWIEAIKVSSPPAAAAGFGASPNSAEIGVALVVRPRRRIEGTRDPVPCALALRSSGQRSGGGSHPTCYSLLGEGIVSLFLKGSQVGRPRGRRPPVDITLPDGLRNCVPPAPSVRWGSRPVPPYLHHRSASHARPKELPPVSCDAAAA